MSAPARASPSSERRGSTGSSAGADGLPGADQGTAQVVEVQRGTEPPVIVDTNIGSYGQSEKDGDRVLVSAVDVGFFEAFRVPVTAGRS